MRRIFRALKIIITIHRYGLYQILKDYDRVSLTAKLVEAMLWFIPTIYKDKPVAMRLRLALESLGPVFVKFGQVLSTRHDILPDNYAIELAKLQSQVKPFDGKLAKQIIEHELKQTIEELFTEFSDEAIASASIAQVHKAILRENNHTVAVKVIRPDIEKVIKKDLKVLKLLAWIIEKFFRDGKRLKPKEVVVEFEKSILAELSFLQEAANATELRRLHKNDNRILIPTVYFDYTTNDVIILEWMDGVPISDIESLKAKNIDLEQLSYNGLAIFYTQVFNFGFFHADMHPGNIFCDDYGRYVGLDFGIVGCLSEEDMRYLAINILAFFNRDYKKVAITHVESGWAPKDTPIEELENAIRAVCEPIFNKPLAQISFGNVLINLFKVSRRFNIPVQPQLILLQKTIVNVEGMGRMLNPNLDLWETAKPFLESWMKKQMGLRGFIDNVKAEMPFWSYILPKLPAQYAKSLHAVNDLKSQNEDYHKLLKSSLRQNRLLLIILIILVIALIMKSQVL